MITHEYIKQCFSYNKETGLLRWLQRPRNHFLTTHEFKRWNTRYSGSVAGSPSHKKASGTTYLQVKIGGRLYPNHRVIVLFVTGTFPANEVDHKNRNGKDNRWENLRDVTAKENMRNKSLQENNKSGHSGVTFDKEKTKWRARISDGEKRIHLGYFDTLDEAVIERSKAELHFNYHPNHGKSLQ